MPDEMSCGEWPVWLWQEKQRRARVFHGTPAPKGQGRAMCALLLTPYSQKKRRKRKASSTTLESPPHIDRNSGDHAALRVAVKDKRVDT